MNQAGSPIRASIAWAIFLAITSIQFLNAQDTESVPRRNTLKIDVTSHLLYRNAMIFSYERVTKPNQSFSITGGLNQFPRLINLGDNVKTTKDIESTGYKFGGEYRFYLARENKFAAPRGVYIGPYASYLRFKNDRDIQVTTEDDEIKSGFLNTEIGVLNIGFEVGYQFVLNNRWTIDLVFVGPSVSNYRAKIRMDGDFDIDEEELYQNEIIQRLISRFPLFDDFIQDKEVDVDGRSSSWAYGYRYQFLVGYHFGRKK